jgi:hypothetical protein
LAHGSASCDRHPLSVRTVAISRLQPPPGSQTAGCSLEIPAKVGMGTGEFEHAVPPQRVDLHVGKRPDRTISTDRLSRRWSMKAVTRVAQDRSRSGEGVA